MTTPHHIKIKFADLAQLTNMHIRLDEDFQMTEDEFFEFCQENRELKFERTKEGNIIVMTPTGLDTGGRNSEMIGELIFKDLPPIQSDHSNYPIVDVFL